MTAYDGHDVDHEDKNTFLTWRHKWGSQNTKY